MFYQVVFGTLLPVLVLQISTKVAAQPQCDGLSLLAANANQSLLLNSCTRDENCTFIECQISDPQTSELVQVALLRVLPCATPMAQVEFQLLDSEEPRYSQMIETSSDINITIASAGFDIPVGTLMTFINHTSDSIGLHMELLISTSPTPVSLFAYTVVPLNLSACQTSPTTEVTTVTAMSTVETTPTMSTTDTSTFKTTTSKSVNLSISMWWIALASLLLSVYV